MFSPDALATAALALAALALIGVAVLLVRHRRDDTTPAVLALQERLDRLIESQHAIPRQVAEGTAEQARSLADLRERLGRLDEAARRLEGLGAAVADVRQLLQVPVLRGTLGEVWLEELLRQVLPAGSYELQYGFRTGERVDAVIRLRDRLVPVDAKFPLEACQCLMELDGEEAERERRNFHRTLRTKIDEIADKYIRPAEGTWEFALMYVPAENVYYEAVIRGADGAESGVSAYARDRRVIPVSPNTLYAYLTVVAHGLRGLEVEARAREILDALGGLDTDVGRLRETVALAGRHLQNAGRQQEEAERQAAALAGRLAGFRGGRGPGSGAGAPRPTDQEEEPA